MGSILRGVLGKILATIDKSANYSVLMPWIFFLLGCVGIYINKPDSKGCTPLMTGCDSGNIAQMLLDRGVDVNAMP